jgi:hypothetical protein
MQVAIDILDFLGAQFLTVASLTSVIVIGAYVWTVSGAHVVRSIQDPASFARVSELGYGRVRRRDVVAASVAGAVNPYVLFDPRQWLRDDDVTWLNNLQKRFALEREEHDGLDAFLADQALKARELPSAMRSLSADEDAPALARHAQRIEDMIDQTVREIAGANDLPEVRAVGSRSRRRGIELLVAFLRDPGSVRGWRALGLELLDYVGRGTSAGLLLAVLTPVDVALLDRIAGGAAIGGGLAILMWQRTLVSRFVNGTLGMRPDLRESNMLRLVSVHPGAAVVAIYMISFCAQGAWTLTSMAMPSILSTAPQ